MDAPDAPDVDLNAVSPRVRVRAPRRTPPNAIVYGSGYIRQKHVMRADVVLNLLPTGVLTVIITALLPRPARLPLVVIRFRSYRRLR